MALLAFFEMLFFVGGELEFVPYQRPAAASLKVFIMHPLHYFLLAEIHARRIISV